MSNRGPVDCLWGREWEALPKRAGEIKNIIAQFIVSLLVNDVMCRVEERRDSENAGSCNTGRLAARDPPDEKEYVPSVEITFFPVGKYIEAKQEDIIGIRDPIWCRRYDSVAE